MTQNHAAVVEGGQSTPHFLPVPEPVAADGEEIVDVLAVGVHHVTRAIATGAHYASEGTGPVIPGVEAVIRRADGTHGLVIARGTMAERIAVPTRAVIPLDGGEPAVLAATLNPLISSWMVLRERVRLTPGQSVLVLGATGASGSLAVQAARLLGAGRVIAAGRDPERLHALAGSADALVRLDRPDTAQALAAAAADVDIVLDYLWGPVTRHALEAILRARKDETQVLDWVQLGSMAGADLDLPASFLRSHAVRLSGSGFGSVPFAAYLREIPAAVAAVVEHGIALTPVGFALSDVDRAWNVPNGPGERTVILP